jgi:hypothetical protein
MNIGRGEDIGGIEHDGRGRSLHDPFTLKADPMHQFSIRPGYRLLF